uniref:leucine-rich repeat domain-containing protein n=1 Tax=Eubacterium cellulosolvens TaxID=29322 RepID=UPI0009DED9E6|nr:leucine-rich repeat domain-containing protein [[Eubacterium] cellulosolvens]
MRKKRFALILAACLLAQSCPYVVTAEQIEKQEATEDVMSASEEVILSGDCSGWNSQVEWRVVKTDNAKKLKLVVFGNGYMKSYSDESGLLIHYIDSELADIAGMADAYVAEVELCKGVTCVGDYAFSNSKIEKVVLPDGLKGIGWHAFEGCEKLREINIPDTVTYIDYYAFQNCKQLKSIKLPGGLTNLGSCAFYASGLTSITIPNSLTGINELTFSDCSSLKEVVFPDEWSGTIDYGAFADCSRLKELRIPEGVKTLSAHIWWSCPKLKTIFLPHSLTRVEGLHDELSSTNIHDVYYNGTENRWNIIFVPNDKDKEMLASGKLKIHFQGEPTPPPAKDEPVAMQRLYHPITQEHFYTKSEHEKNVLVSRGWKYEGIGWYAPEDSDTPVYRLYNPFVNDHHYTTSSYERDVLSQKYGWIDEGIGWYSDDDKSVPLYRRYCPFLKSGSHHYTPALNEAKHLLTVGWKDEGIAWYGLKEDKKK